MSATESWILKSGILRFLDSPPNPFSFFPEPEKNGLKTWLVVLAVAMRCDKNDIFFFSYSACASVEIRQKSAFFGTFFG